MRVVVIGGGFSGTVLAASLIRPGVEVLLLEKTGTFGAGIAYGTDDPLHLLNVPAAKMSANPEEPGQFVEWLRKRGIEDAFVPRGLYRRYLQDLLQGAEGLTRVVDEATALRDGFRIETKSGQVIEADYVVLATGHLPETRFGGPLPQGSEGARVVLIGSGLTAVDAALSVLSEHPTKVVTAISQSGSLPETFDPSAPPYALSHSFDSKTLRRVLRSVRKEIAHAKAWHSVFDAMRPHWEVVWQNLSERDQRRFLNHLASRFDKHRHRTPPPAAAALERYAMQGRFRLIQGKVVQVSPGKVVYEQGGEAQCLEADQVIDCSGRSAKWSETRDPFMRDLFDKGYVQAGPHGMGIVADDMGQVQERLYAIGPMLRGTRWETTAVAELRVQAATVRDAILEDIRCNSAFK